MKTSAALTIGAAGLAVPPAASPALAQGARPAFEVAPTFIPAARASEVFPVRRI